MARDRFSIIIYLWMVLALVSLALAVREGQGYHAQVGIPAAIRIYKAETTAAPNESRVFVSANLAAHSYLVGIVIDISEAYSVCGSSLLKNTHALTAAHCWDDGFRRAEQFTMVFGSEYIFVGGIRKQTTAIHTHPLWYPHEMINDLAMVTFERVEYSEYVQPIALPTVLHDKEFVGYWAQASGYGRVIPGSLGYHPDQMQTVVNLQVVPTVQCVSPLYRYMRRIVCARDNQPSNCISHSGGPLVTVHYNQRYLIGVASFGDYNCAKGMLSGFVRVTFYMKWILKILG